MHTCVTRRRNCHLGCGVPSLGTGSAGQQQSPPQNATDPPLAAWDLAMGLTGCGTGRMCLWAGPRARMCKCTAHTSTDANAHGAHGVWAHHMHIVCTWGSSTHWRLLLAPVRRPPTRTQPEEPWKSRALLYIFRAAACTRLSSSFAPGQPAPAKGSPPPPALQARWWTLCGPSS